MTASPTDPAAARSAMPPSSPDPTAELSVRAQAALLDFFTVNNLRMLLRQKMSVDLDRIVNTSQSAEVVVFDLLRWAEREGRLRELLTAAAADRPSQPELAALREECKAGQETTPRPGELWTILEMSTLQPAPHFAGRTELLGELSAWAVAPNDSARVRALVAAGGTGKTAIAERVLRGMPAKNPFGVFVWSFYENPQTEAFLRAACKYFLGNAPKETGGLLEHLQHGLRAADLPHLLILDGLELVQATGIGGRSWGELEDPLMKRFLRWLAAGRGTRAKALITSRFPLPDLADWIDNGFKPVELEDLDNEAARVVLRKRGVKGTDAELDALAESVHGHALTVDVLGLYLHRFAGGDPKKASEFDLKVFAKHQKAERLSKVLASYAANLPDVERDLLARLSLFPRGVTVEWLLIVSGAAGDVAGALVGCDQRQLLDLLEGLREIGLVFSSELGGERTYSAHPFLRDFFRGLLGATNPNQVHETVRKHVAVSLAGRPSDRPTDPALMDSYERLIEITRLAGQVEEAFSIYERILGQYEYLGSGRVGDYTRGLRILCGFSADGTPASIDTRLNTLTRAGIANEWGLYARELGDLPKARALFAISQETYQTHSEWFGHSSIAVRNRAVLESRAGRWAEAIRFAAVALSNAEKSGKLEIVRAAHTDLAVAYAATGRLAEARTHFSHADNIRDAREFAFRAAREAEFKLKSGNRTGALSQVLPSRDINQSASLLNALALTDTVAGRSLLPDDPVRARTHLNDAREYANKTGNIELTLRCYHLAAEIARHEKNDSLAESDALDGIQLADSCGFGRWSLDIRTELAQIHLAANEPKKAIEPAEWVLKRSLEEDCQYAWGVADSLHLLGVTHARLDDKVKARDYLTRAVEKRRPLEHPGLAETEAELAKLG